MTEKDERREFNELIRAVGAPRRSNPFTILYRWRYECAAAVVVPTALVELDRAVGPIFGLLVVFAVASTVWHWPALRRWCRARVRGIVVQHRLRTAFARARVATLDGHLPWLVWTVPEEEVVSVLVHCPAGLDPELIGAHRETLAAACFATEVTVTRHARRADLVWVSVR